MNHKKELQRSLWVHTPIYLFRCVVCLLFLLALYLISISIFLAPSLAGTPPYECLRNFISQGLKGSTMGIYGVFIRCLTRFHAGAVCVGSIS